MGKYLRRGLKLTRPQFQSLFRYGQTRMPRGRKGGGVPVHLTKTQVMGLRSSLHRPVVLRMSPAQLKYNRRYGGGIWSSAKPHVRRVLKSLVPAFASDIRNLSGRFGQYVGNKLKPYGLDAAARRGISSATEYAIKRASGGRVGRGRARKRAGGIYL